MKSGIVKLSVKDYDALEAVRSTDLKTITSKSPLHYHYRQSFPEEPTPSMIVGDAFHAATLEPERFAAEYVTFEGTRRGKAWDVFRAAHVGASFITATERETVEGMAAAVRAFPLVQPFLRGRPEMSILWTDPETGLACKARADMLNEDESETVIVGLKSARDAGQHWFQRQVADLLYHLSWAYYCDGYEAVTGKRPRMIEIAVESTPPYDVVPYEIPDSVICAGRTLYRDALETLAVCRRDSTWPGQALDDVVELQLPTWAPGMAPSEPVPLMVGERLIAS